MAKLVEALRSILMQILYGRDTILTAQGPERALGHNPSAEIPAESRVALLALVIGSPCALRPTYTAAGTFARFASEWAAFEAIGEGIAWTRSKIPSIASATIKPLRTLPRKYHCLCKEAFPK